MLPPVPVVLPPVPVVVVVVVVVLPPVPPASGASQTPPMQVPIEQGEPSGLAGLEHWPETASQVPGKWQSSVAGQLLGVPMHTPPMQVAFCSQVSAHEVPSARLGLEHMP